MQEHNVEIDRSKAYTWAYNQIVEVPVFNQFDVWKAYDYTKHDFNEFGDLTIYLVRAEGEALMFFNKPYLLIHGMFLKHLHEKCKILYYKRPSHIYKVSYRNTTHNLWETTISNKRLENAKMKKLIANANIRQLDKGNNKAQKSLVFDTSSDALYHQTIHGGRINKISRWYEDEELVEMIDEDIKELKEAAGMEDRMDEEIKWSPYTGDQGQYNLNLYKFGHCRINDGKYYDIQKVEKETEAKYYALTVSDTTEFTSGFKYIKGLLSQIHNFRMYEDYYKLVDAGIQVNYVKTDAFQLQRRI